MDFSSSGRCPAPNRLRETGARVRPARAGLRGQASGRQATRVRSQAGSCQTTGLR